jgi:hypothetical protein
VLGHLLRFRPLALVLAVVTVLGTATATADAPTGETIYDVLDGQDVRLDIPPTADPQGLAIFFHGMNGGAENRMDEPWLQALKRSGWVVASSDFHTASWGNPASTQDTVNLIEWAEKQSGVQVRLFVSGSMGGTVSLNAMSHGVEAPACWYGVKPALDLTRMDAVPGANRAIDKAFGGEPVPSNRNPVDNIDSLSTDTRYRVVASKNDTWVVYEENAGPLVDGLEARGGDISILEVQGTHDDPSHFDVGDLVEFASTC